MLDFSLKKNGYYTFVSFLALQQKKRTIFKSVYRVLKRNITDTRTAYKNLLVEIPVVLVLHYVLDFSLKKEANTLL